MAKEEKLQGDKYISNGIERGQMTLVVMKINNTISGGKQGNFNYNGRTLLYDDKENSVQNFEKEYLGIRV